MEKDLYKYTSLNKLIINKYYTELLMLLRVVFKLNPKYAVKKLLRIETTSKQGISLTYFNSP